jgi:hypothetical protein
LGFTESLQQRYTSSGVVRRSLRSASSEGPRHLRSRLGLVLVLVWSWSGLGRSASSWSGLGRSASSWSGLVACCVAHARSHDWPPPGGSNLIFAVGPDEELSVLGLCPPPHPPRPATPFKDPWRRGRPRDIKRCQWIIRVLPHRLARRRLRRLPDPRALRLEKNATRKIQPRLVARELKQTIPRKGKMRRSWQSLSGLRVAMPQTRRRRGMTAPPVLHTMPTQPSCGGSARDCSSSGILPYESGVSCRMPHEGRQPTPAACNARPSNAVPSKNRTVKSSFHLHNRPILGRAAGRRAREVARV